MKEVKIGAEGLYDLLRETQGVNASLAANQALLRNALDNALELNKQLQENQDILAETQRIARLGSWEFNLLTQRVTWSEETYRIYGLTPDTVVLSFEGCLSKIYADDRPVIAQAVTDAIQEGKPYEWEVRILLPDGTVRWTLSVGKPKSDEAGRVVKLMGITQDIHERKLAEEQLKEQNKELRKINTELDRFVYRASHDLRAPLASVLGLIGIAREETGEANRVTYFDLMAKSVAKMDTFIQSIVDHSRNARLKVHHQAIDFEELVKESFDDLKYMPGSEEMEKRIHIHEKGTFLSDRFRLKIIFNNIISNAIRYRDPRHPSFIDIAVETDETHALIRFTDNGIGIARENQDKIFDMFYRATDSNVGSGLGLYIVKEVIEALQGKIEVESELGKGTTFRLMVSNCPPLSLGG